MRAGAELSEWLTEGENGDAMGATLIGDCAIPLPVVVLEADPGVTTVLVELVLLAISGFVGSSSQISTGFWGVIVGFGMGSTGDALEAAEPQGGGGSCGGGCIVECEVAGEVSFGASDLASILGDIDFGLRSSSASLMSTSGLSAGVGSFTGVLSRGGEGSLTTGSTEGSGEISISTVSSSEGDAAVGEGEDLLQTVSRSSMAAGDLTSNFTEVDRLRKDSSLSSWAC